MKMRIFNLFIKRIFDFFTSFFLLFLFILPMLIIAIIVLIYDKGPIFFIQERAGLNGKLIKVFKFKTLIQKSNKSEKVASNLGKFLRLTRLDELPQVLNVLMGDLSFVGPRPLYQKYNKLYNNEQRQRLKMKPGITGWAQINGDNNISWEKKFKLDIWYIQNFNFLLDLKIIILTIKFFINSMIDFKKNKKNKIIIDEEFNGKN